jgi:hypothetical protein
MPYGEVRESPPTRFGQLEEKPPSTKIVCPVTYADAALARKTTTPPSRRASVSFTIEAKGAGQGVDN